MFVAFAHNREAIRKNRTARPLVERYPKKHVTNPRKHLLYMEKKRSCDAVPKVLFRPAKLRMLCKVDQNKKCCSLVQCN